MNDLKKSLLKELRKRKYSGMAQYEIEALYNFSRSYISETLTFLENDNIIIRKNTGKLTKRIWLPEYYPGIIDNYIRIGILRSSEYSLFLSLVYKINDKKIKIIAYNNTVELMNAIVNNALEFALSPLFSQIIYSLTNNNVLMLAPVSSGGSSIIGKNIKNNTLYTSEISSMMLFTKEFIKAGNDITIKTYDNPLNGLKEFKNNGRYIVIWEPYATYISETGYITVMDYKSLMNGDPCCFISTNKNYYSKNKKFIDDLMIRYKNYDKFDENVLKYISKITKIKKSTVEKSLDNYNFKLEFDLNDLKNYVEKLGIVISDEKLKSIYNKI